MESGRRSYAATAVRTPANRLASGTEGRSGHRGVDDGVPQALDAVVPDELFPSRRLLHAALHRSVRRTGLVGLPGRLVLPPWHTARHAGGLGERGACGLLRR